MNRPWFDPVTGTLTFDEYVAERTSYQKAVQDGVVTATEFAAQAERVAALFRELENALNPETKQIATDAMAELAVLNALAMLHTLTA